MTEEIALIETITAFLGRHQMAGEHDAGAEVHLSVERVPPVQLRRQPQLLVRGYREEPVP